MWLPKSDTSNGIRAVTVDNTLQDWLDIATRGLCADAKARVRKEVHEHFAAEYERLIVEGHTEQLATYAALQSLGGAKQAQDRFCKLHFTVTEFDVWNALHRPPSLVRKSFASFFITIWIILGLARLATDFERDVFEDIGFLAFQLLLASFLVIPVLLGGRAPRFVLCAQMILAPVGFVGIFFSLADALGVLNWITATISLLIAVGPACSIWTLNLSILGKTRRQRDWESAS